MINKFRRVHVNADHGACHGKLSRCIHVGFGKLGSDRKYYIGRCNEFLSLSVRQRRPEIPRVVFSKNSFTGRGRDQEAIQCFNQTQKRHTCRFCSASGNDQRTLGAAQQGERFFDVGRLCARQRLIDVKSLSAQWRELRQQIKRDLKIGGAQPTAAK